MGRKEELLAEMGRLRSELMEITDAEDEAKYAGLIGNCYRYRNSYSCPQGPADYWWLYKRVLSVDGCVMRVFAFQRDKNGHVDIDPDHPTPAEAVVGGGSMRITLQDFTKAWREVTSVTLPRLPGD